MRIIGALIAVTMTLGVAPADAQRSTDRKVDKHLERGLQLFRQRKYERAIAHFKRGYALQPRRELLFAMAQAERLSGDCQSALVYYQSFLSRNPPARQAAAARDSAERCRRALANGPEGRNTIPKPSAPPPSVVRASARGDVSRAVGPPPWYRDRAGMALLGGAAVSATLASAFLLGAGSASSSARDAGTYAEYDAQLARATTRRRWGVVTGVAALGLAAGAAYRLLWKRPTARVRVVAGVGGASTVGIGGVF